MVGTLLPGQQLGHSRCTPCTLAISKQTQTRSFLFSWTIPTLYKLYAVPVRVCSTREDMHYPWGYALPVSHIISTRESYPQYPWGYALPVSHIISTREDMQYPWVISSVPVSHILSTREDMHYPWGKFHSFFIHINLLTGTAYPHGYWGYDLRVLMIWLTGTAYPHGYWGYDSRVLKIWLTGTAYPHGYWGYDSRVLHILTGTEDMTHGYCISSQVLRIWLTGNAYPHGYWGYDSQVLMIWLTGNAYPHGYCIPSRVLHIVYTGWYQLQLITEHAFRRAKILNWYKDRNNVFRGFHKHIHSQTKKLQYASLKYLKIAFKSVLSPYTCYVSCNKKTAALFD